MKTLLQINSSIFSSGGQSSQLADEFVSAWHAAQADANVIVRDLAREPVPHLTAERFQSFLAEAAERNVEQQAATDYSNKLIDELKRADVIVLGLPLYNFGVPSTLKAYFDHIARAGVTFRYTTNGPVGLLTGKKAYVFAARGGFYVGTPLDTQTAYVRHFLTFIGISDIEFIYAEGLGVGSEQKQKAIAGVKSTIAKLTAAIPTAAAA